MKYIFLLVAVVPLMWYAGQDHMTEMLALLALSAGALWVVGKVDQMRDEEVDPANTDAAPREQL